MIAPPPDLHPELRVPRHADWYRQFPFNSALTFAQEDGTHWRYVVTPTDEQYLVDPTGWIQVGFLPPEEMEVRDYLLALVLLRSRVSKWDMVKALLLRWPSQTFIAHQAAFRSLFGLCERSREHRAAFLRLSKSQSLPPGIRGQLASIVCHCDLSARRDAARS